MNRVLLNEERQQLKSIRLLFIYIAGTLGALLLLAIAFSQVQGPLMPGISVNRKWLLAGAALISFIFTVSAKKQIRTGIYKARHSPEPLTGKLVKYRRALVVYMLLSGLSILVCLAFSLLTGDFVFQVFAAVLLGYLLAEAPREEKILARLP